MARKIKKRTHRKAIQKRGISSVCVIPFGLGNHLPRKSTPEAITMLCGVSYSPEKVIVLFKPPPPMERVPVTCIECKKVYNHLTARDKARRR